jgi:hypothetical protein
MHAIGMLPPPPALALNELTLPVRFLVKPQLLTRH